VEVRNAISGGFRAENINWKAILLCLGAAMVFWLFNALNKEHTADLQYPVQIVHNAEQFVPAGKLPDRVPLNVTGKGWNLLAASLGVRMDPVIIDPLSQTGVTRIGADELMRQFSPALGKLRINYFKIDSLTFEFEPRVRKMVRLVPDLSGLVMLPGYEAIAPVNIRPDSVWLDGPASVVAAVPDPLPVRPVEDRISGEYRRSVLLSPVGDIRTKPRKAEISFLAIKMNSFTWMVPVKLLPVKVPGKWKADRDSVSVVFRMRADRTLNRDSFRPVASVQPVSRERIQTCVPVLSGLQPGIRVVSMDSVVIRRN